MKIYKGTKIDIEFHYLDEDLQAKDMSAYSFKLIGKQDINQIDAEFELSNFNIANSGNGLLILNFNTVDIDANYYVCQCVATKENSVVISKIFSIEIMESLI